MDRNNTVVGYQEYYTCTQTLPDDVPNVLNWWCACIIHVLIIFMARFHESGEYQDGFSFFRSSSNPVISRDQLLQTGRKRYCFERWDFLKSSQTHQIFFSGWFLPQSNKSWHDCRNGSTRGGRDYLWVESKPWSFNPSHCFESTFIKHSKCIRRVFT